MELNLPLMQNNVTRRDIDTLIEYLKQDNPRLTQGEEVAQLEIEWSKWLDVKYSVFVNSGNSANILTMAALKHLYGGGEIIVPTLTWVSDIASVLLNNFTPVFVDANFKNLAMDEEQILSKLSSKTRAVFLTHVLGFNGLSDRLLEELQKRNILLIEDVCESHGATHKGRRLGSYGFASNFSFYFAHHMTTIEGGMVCTNNEELYETVRMMRSHGMVREVKSQNIKDRYKAEYPDLNPDFIFSYPAYNMRSTELNAVLGRSQLKNLDNCNLERIENCRLFYENLDGRLYHTDFDFVGCVNYAFVLILRQANDSLRDKIELTLKKANVEFRRGTAGGGNQLRQPYLKNIFGNMPLEQFSVVDHIHFYGFYIGNYPGLESSKIKDLCDLLNSLEK